MSHTCISCFGARDKEMFRIALRLCGLESRGAVGLSDEGSQFEDGRNGNGEAAAYKKESVATDRAKAKGQGSRAL